MGRLRLRGGGRHDGTSQRFFWQGILIVLPLAVLAAAGIWSLRGQRLAVEQQARIEATRSAESWAAELQRSMRERFLSAHRPVPLEPDGEPFPFLFPLNPTPARNLDADRDLLAAQDDPDALEQILIDHPDARSAAGLPIRVLALYRLHQLAGETDQAAIARRLLDAAVISHPSILTGPILNELEQKYPGSDGAWLQSDYADPWVAQDEIRALLRVHRESFRMGQRSRWVVGIGGKRFRMEVLDHPEPDRQILQVMSLDDLAAGVMHADHTLGFRGEAYYDGIRIFPRPDGGSVGLDGPELSPFASGQSAEISTYLFLRDPKQVYAQHDRQVRWFVGLIAGAALTAIAGLWIARRAFLKQQAVSRMKSNFVSSVSHELRAPVASIRLIAERLRAGKVDAPEKRQEYFGFIEQESRRLATLVENVLDFSRIEDGRKTYHFKETDIEQLATETVQLMSPHATEKDVTLKTEFQPPEQDPAIDPMEIQQALINLIDNAIKYSPTGGQVTIGISGGPDRICLWVQDHGPGIPEEEQQRIFQRFYRVGSELERETEGVGIGLAIVRHTAEAHGGRVRVVSSAQSGSRFTLDLPISQERS